MKLHIAKSKLKKDIVKAIDDESLHNYDSDFEFKLHNVSWNESLVQKIGFIFIVLFHVLMIRFLFIASDRLIAIAGMIIFISLPFAIAYYRLLSCRTIHLLKNGIVIITPMMGKYVVFAREWKDMQYSRYKRMTDKKIMLSVGVTNKGPGGFGPEIPRTLRMATILAGNITYFPKLGQAVYLIFGEKKEMDFIENKIKKISTEI